MTPNTDNLVQYVLCYADNAMILGQRLSEWCGHGPALEQDIAITNIALDLIGEARMWYQYAAEFEGNGKTEDDYPYKRVDRQWRNVLLVEQPNGHFGHTIFRQFMFDCFHYYFSLEMMHSNDQRLSEIAAKSNKEASYHLKYSSEWMLRLGNGTDESHQKMQEATDDLYIYFNELFEATPFDESLMGIAPDLSKVKERATLKFNEIMKETSLDIPEVKYPQTGGRKGIHSEHLGYILTELQFLQKTYPNAQW